ncbi:MAG: hypothetical protein ACFB0A_10490 [Croceivirga sp.]
MAQNDISQLSFYKKLGIQDAKREITLGNLNVEDEKDFWNDQKNFEALLKKKNRRHYQSYLNGKYQVYREYQILCAADCNLSETFSRRMAFYLIKGESVGTEGFVLELNK